MCSKTGQLSGAHSTLPPAVGYVTFGTMSASRFPVATSYRYAVPTSLPFSDNETMTCLPSYEAL